jgi:hypothetical protein
MPAERASVHLRIPDLINALANGQNNQVKRIEALGIIQDPHAELDDTTRHWITRLVEMGWRNEGKVRGRNLDTAKSRKVVPTVR